MTYILNATSAALRDDAVEATTVNTHSQHSSLVETSASQRSQFGLSPTELPEPLQTGAGGDVTTPSSSLSNHSSQGNVPNGRSVNGSQITHDRRTPAHLAPMASSPAPNEDSRVEHTSGLKRTATGQIKSPWPESLPTSPVNSNLYGHSRNTSATSRSSHIGEISSKLQARLSYAKVKVQNGWENHSISELERMTSSHNSPIAVSSNTTRGYDTPPAPYSPVDDILPARNLQRASTNTPPEDSFASPPIQGVARSSGDFSRKPTASGTSIPITRPHETYEQFWQSHSHTTMPHMRRSNHPLPSVPSLAPPVELSSRTATASKHQSPQLRTDQHFPGHLPSTPPPRGNALAKIRTPSQQAAVEQDALEGLLSMNSPANSQSHRPTTRASFRSPLQSQAVGPAVVLNGFINGPPVDCSRPIHITRAPRDLNDDEMNKMLDEMPESSSSDEDGPVKRRVAARAVVS